MRHKDKVKAARKLHQRRQGKIYAAVLGVRTSVSETTSCIYSYAYINPMSIRTGLDGDGNALEFADIELFQEGEAYAPKPDDSVTVNGATYRLNNVRSRLNGDAGYAVHDCSGVRPV